MATTERIHCGFHSGGLLEAASTVGTPAAVTTPIRTNGVYSMELAGAATQKEYRLAWITSTAGKVDGLTPTGDLYVLVGCYIRFTDLTPATAYDFMRLETQIAGDFHVRLQLLTNGNVRVFDANDAQVGSDITAPFAAINTWYRLELFNLANDTTGQIKIWVENASVFTATNQDTVGTSTGTALTHFLGPAGAADGIVYISDVYQRSDTAAEPARPGSGGWEVLAYQSGNLTATRDEGTANLDTGVWNDAGKTPWTTANAATYTATNVTGNVNYDDAASGGRGPGPSGGAYTIGTIISAMWWWWVKRGTGAGTVHNGVYGNNVDARTTTAAWSLATADEVRAEISSNTALVPLATEVFAQGFATGGAQDITCEEMCATLLNEVASGPVSVNVLAVAATAPAAAPLPAVQIARAVDAVTATAPAAAPLPTIATVQVVNIAAVAGTSDAAAPLPTITAQVTTSVLAIAATAPAAAPLPSVQIARAIDAVAATAPAAAPLPTIAAIQVVNVTAVAATADAAAPLPTITAVTGAVEVLAVTATAPAAAPLPTITAVQIVNVAGVTATAPAEAPVPTVQAQVTVSVSGVTATAPAAAPLPTIAAQITVSVVAVAATSPAAAPLPTIAAQIQTSVSAVTASAPAAAPLPTITALVIATANIVAVTVTAIAAAPLPAVTVVAPGTVTLSVAAATAGTVDLSVAAATAGTVDLSVAAATAGTVELLVGG